jgi:hypothetical protein
MGEQPSAIIHVNGPPLTEQQVAELRERLAAILASPTRRYRYLYRGRWRYALPLSWHTRLRLWCTSQVDGVAIWLCDHGRFGAAEALWRTFGHWSAG